MAQNTDLNIAANTWTMITDSAVSAATWQNKSEGHIEVKATIGTTPPTNFLSALKYGPYQGAENKLLSDLWPGLVGRDRLWVYSSNNATVMISHA